MCTVTYIPVKDKFIITSNRDEKRSRMLATPPIYYTHPNGNLVFPKDKDAGGSWIALKENGDAVVLLNGAFENHISNPPYKMSRGILLLEIFKSEHPIVEISNTDFESIEPFTLILIENNCLYELRWDGENKHIKQLSISHSYIWSSPTLYNKIARKIKEQRFTSFLNTNIYPTQQDVIKFHQTPGDGENNAGLVMGKNKEYATVSICSILLTADRGSMKYLDLKTRKKSEVKFELTSVSNSL